MTNKEMTREEKDSEIRSIEREIKIWTDVSIPKTKASIKYFIADLVKCSVAVARLEAKITALKE